MQLEKAETISAFALGPKETKLTTHNTHKRQTFLPPAGFENAIPACERPKTHALERADTGVTEPLEKMKTSLNPRTPYLLACLKFFNFIWIVVGILYKKT
jgi:hypothetical protein